LGPRQDDIHIAAAKNTIKDTELIVELHATAVATIKNTRVIQITKSCRNADSSESVR